MVQLLPTLDFPSKDLQRSAPLSGLTPTSARIKPLLPLNKQTARAVVPQAVPLPRRQRSSQSHNHTQRVAQTCTLFNQPTEIVLLISDFLDNSSRAAFSLSCKTSYILAGPAPGVKFPLDARQRAALLQNLERDATVGNHLYYCNRCIVLHLFEDCQMKPPVLTLDRQLCSTWKFRPMGSSLRMDYCHARLVMNRHLRGPLHGLPLESLDLTSTSSRSCVDLIQSRTARIIDDMLFIRSEHKVVPKRATISPDAFYRHLYIFSLNICHHQETDHVRTISPEVLRFAAKSRPPMLNPLASITRKSTSQGSCKRCSTDYETTVQIENNVHESRQPTLTATVVSYQLLGGCRSAVDSLSYGLFNMSQFSTSENNYWRDMKLSPEGSVQRRWVASNST